MSLSTTIKTIQDIMRKDAGVDGDAQRISQLVWMLFLKVFDDAESEREMMEDRYRSPIPSKLRWRNWAADAEGITGDELLDFANNELFKTLKELSVGGKNAALAGVVRSVFEDAYNYMKSGTLMRQVINKLNEIDFNRASDRHEFGEVYEKLLSDLQNAGNAGEFYTPRAVTQFMVDQVDPKLGETLLDPACGTGGFLVCSIEHIRKKYVKDAEDEVKLQSCIHGVEKKPLPHLLCVTNMLFHGIAVPSQIRHDNTLARPLRDYGPKDRVDVIVFNPYTSIKTNLLFFTKGEPTKTIWFYEHPYPAGAKSYSKTKPLRIEEFAPEKKWWQKRKETDQAWKVPLTEIKDRAYNLDIKNPRAIEDGPGDADTLLQEYKQAAAEAAKIRDMLRDELANALKGLS